MSSFIPGILMTILLGLISNGIADDSGPYQKFPELRGPYLGQTLPENSPQIFGEGYLKPPAGYHSSITFSPDMKEAYWTSMGEHTFCSKLQNGIWTTPAEIRFDSAGGIGEVALSSDGNGLYFLSRKAAGRERIWYSQRVNDAWSAPRLLDSAITAHPTHWQFSLADNGNLYFTSEIDGVRGQGDIYVAVRDSFGFRPPIALGPAINSDHRDFTPFIAHDESYLIFARGVPQENNRSDLFISFKDAQGKWTSAVNMGDTINTGHNEVCPVVTPDDKYLIYGSVSSERNEVYWISAAVIENLKPPQ